MSADTLASGKMLQTMECKLPFEQIMDTYDPSVVLTSESLDELAHSSLEVGKKINQKAVVLSDPHKSNVDYANGIGRMPTISIRKRLVEIAELQDTAGEDLSNKLILPFLLCNRFFCIILNYMQK